MKICDCGYATGSDKARCCKCGKLMVDEKVFRVIYHVTGNDALLYQMDLDASDEAAAREKFKAHRVNRTIIRVVEMTQCPKCEVIMETDGECPECGSGDTSEKEVLNK